MPDEKDQAKETEKVSRQSQFDKEYDKGWKAVEEMTTIEAAKRDVATQDDECVGCDEAEKARRKEEKAKKSKETSTPEKPYKVLKVQGKDVPVSSEDELVKLAQMGADYTKKTQALSEDRKTAEAEFKAKVEAVEAQATKMNALVEKLMAGGFLPEAKTAAEKKEAVAEVAAGPTDKSAIYAQFDIDPNYAQPQEKKMVEAIYSMRKDMDDLKAFVGEAKSEKVQSVIDSIIADERKKFPFEEITNDQGQNLTALQFQAVVNAKRQALGLTDGQPIPPDQIAPLIRDAVKEVHLLQQKSKDSAVSDFSDGMTEDEFIAKHPDLANRLKTKFGTQAVTEVDAKRAKIPPTLSPIKGQETKPGKGSPEKRKSLGDYLDAGFEDPETLRAITGG